MPEHTTCNLCGGDDAQLLYRLADYRLWTDELEWNVVRCRGCGLGYLDPRPTPEELPRYYPAAYFAHRDGPDAFERYRRLAAYVPGEGGRLLDIGTATGRFLALMREGDWEVEGIEPGDAGNPHGITIHQISFPEESPLPSNRFDVITAWAVFEHLYDPMRAFRECARMLKPGGNLVIQVPNLRSIWGRWAQQEDVPRHVHFFSEPVLRRYAEETGLRLLEVVHTTDLFGGSGRGVLRLLVVRALGGSTRDFHRMMAVTRKERLRRWPVRTPLLVGVSAVERTLLSDRLVRALRVSGQVVARFEKNAEVSG